MHCSRRESSLPYPAKSAGPCPAAMSLIFMGFPAPYMRAAPHTQTVSPYIPADPIHIRNPHTSQFPHIDLMPAETSGQSSKPTHPTGLTTFPAPASGSLKYASGQLTQIPWGAWARRHLVTRRRRRSGAPRSSRPEGRRLRPRAWIPEESGQAGLDKSPQTRRQGNRIRRTNDGSRGPPARPGVMHALRRWSTVSLSF